MFHEFITRSIPRAAGLAVLVGSLALAPSALAQAAHSIKRNSVEILSGKILSQTDTVVKFEHPVLSVLNLPRNQIAVLQNLFMLNVRTNLFASADFLPSLRDFSQHCFVAKGGLKFVIDPKSGTNLKLGAEDRDNSEPGTGRKKNDVEYFLTVGWDF